MVLIVGLGNPGEKYEKTRHNIGFRAVDEIAANFQLPITELAVRQAKEKKRFISSPFNFQSIFNAKISKGKIANKKVILAKPQTFMNNSGQAVKKIIKNLKLEIKNLIIIHDDIDLPLGKIRIVKNRGSAGHKGVESMIKELRMKNFTRFRIGVCPKAGKPKKPEGFVLKKFSRDEEKIVKEVIEKTVEAIRMAIKEGVEKAMSLYNC